MLSCSTIVGAVMAGRVGACDGDDVACHCHCLNLEMRQAGNAM